MSITPTSYQWRGADHLTDTPHALLHWDAGVGKTQAAGIAMFRAINEGVCVYVTPAIARFNVKRELEFAMERISHKREYTIQIIEKGKDPLEGDIIVISYDLLHKKLPELRKLEIDVLIIDESQYAKSFSAKRTKALFGFHGLHKNAKNTWCLTGTPCPNNSSELYPMVSALWPEVISRDGRVINFARFRDAFCQTEENDFGIQIKGTNVENTKWLWNKLRPYIDRKRKEQVLQELPPIRFSKFAVEGSPLTKEVRKLERELGQQIDLFLDDDDFSPQVHMTTLRRATELAKTPDAIAIAKQELTDGSMEKVVIFASFLESIESLEEGLKDFNPVVVTGKVTGAKRQDFIDRFQDDDTCRVFIGQIEAASTAITLHAHGKCTDVIIVSASWTPATNAQAVARIHRKGQPNSVHARFLHLANSLDEKILGKLLSKSKQLCAVYGERRHHAG